MQILIFASIKNDSRIHHNTTVTEEASPAQRVSWQTSDAGCSVWLCRCLPWSRLRCENGSSWGCSPVRAEKNTPCYCSIINTECAVIPVNLINESTRDNGVCLSYWSHVNWFSQSCGRVPSLWITSCSALLAEDYGSSARRWVGGCLRSTGRCWKFTKHVLFTIVYSLA